METAIRAEGLVKQFGSVRALDGLTLSVHRGEILGVLGPNGSGKSTLIRIVAGLVRPTSGVVEVLGRRLPASGVAARIGYMTQSPALYDDLTVTENLVFFGRLYGLPGARAKERARELVHLVSLEDKADTPVGQLSGGMKQRTNLACSLIHEPEVVLLDEPTVGVDPKLRRSLWDYFRRLNESGTTLVVSTHIMDEVERCHRVAMIEQGRTLAVGTADELRKLSGEDNLEDAFLAFSRASQRAGEVVAS